MGRVTIGLSNQKIGERLGIAADTAKQHICRSLEKTKCKNRTLLATWAARQALQELKGLPEAAAVMRRIRKIRLAL